MQEFKGKTVVVTGGGSGIGAAMCRSFAAEGSQVVVADIEQEKAQEVAANISAAGGEAVAMHVDITRADSCDELARQCQSVYGDVHLLVANAGVLMLGTLATRTEKDWQWVFDVNVFGTIRTVNAFLPQLKINGGDAHIVITNSMAGLMASAPGKGVYNASKHAQMSYAETLRDEIAADGIGVTLLMPGATDSEITNSERNRPESSGRGEALSDKDLEVLLAHLGESGETVSPEHCIRNLAAGIRDNAVWVMAGSPQRAAIQDRFARISAAFAIAELH